MKTRVMIVEDHNLLRKGLRSLISGMVDYEVVGEACDGKEAIQQAGLLRPELILMDLSMPGLSGFEATSQIKRRLPGCRVIILTVSKNSEFVREALRIGADGYMLKGASFEELSMAMQTVSQGKKFICNDISMQLMDGMLNPDAVTTDTPWERLNERERSVLKLIGEGHTNRSAGEFLCISPKTIEKHRANLMRKLMLHNAAELVLTAIDMGLVERPAQQSLRAAGFDIPGFMPQERRRTEDQAAIAVLPGKFIG